MTPHYVPVTHQSVHHAVPVQMVPRVMHQVPVQHVMPTQHHVVPVRNMVHAIPVQHVAMPMQTNATPIYATIGTPMMVVPTQMIGKATPVVYAQRY